jgi:hypothetical protein
MKIILTCCAVLILNGCASEDDYKGYSCTDDCSGHDAGYEWAKDNGVDNSNDCDGDSNSFIEGCEAYAEEQVEIPLPGRF